MISGYCMLPSLQSSSSLRHFLSKARGSGARDLRFLSTLIGRVTSVCPDRLHGLTPDKEFHPFANG